MPADQTDAEAYRAPVDVASPTEPLWDRQQRLAAAAAVLVGIVARWWALGSSPLSFDESFTAAYSSLPLNDIPSALRANDTHPPLDYLLRHVLPHGHSEWLLRAPSVLFSTLALVALALWMRRRSWFGVLAVALFAINPFQLLVGRQARMYALMCLLGVLVAMVADRWQRSAGSDRLAIAVGALVALACLDHSGGLFLAVGVLAVPGLRRDPAAWRWRASTAAGVAVWAVLWAPSFLQQSGGGGPGWVRYTSPASLGSLFSGFVSMFSGSEALGALLVLGGGAALWALDRRLGRLWLALFAVPLVLLAMAGTRYHVLLTRTLAASSWAVPVGLAALAALAWHRRAAVGAVVGVLVVAVSLRSVPAAVGFDEGESAALVTAGRSLEPGDTLLVHPGWLWPLAWWNLRTDHLGPDSTRVVGVEGYAWEVPGAAPTGRVWVARPSSYGFTADGERCATTVTSGEDWLLDCLVVPPS